MAPWLQLSGWRLVTLGLVAVVLPLRIMWTMQTQMRLEDSSEVHQDLAELRGSLQGLLDGERLEHRRRISGLEGSLSQAREQAAQASREAAAARQEAAAAAQRAGEAAEEVQQLRALVALEGQRRAASPSAGLGAAGVAPGAAAAEAAAPSTSSSPAYSQKSNDAQTPRPEAQPEGPGDEEDWAPPEEKRCPRAFPHAYKPDDRGFASHCCSVPENCRGEAIDAAREFECCGGDHRAIGFAYHYEGPGESEVECDKYDWWQRLENAEGPLWAPLKEHATIASKADAEALVKAGFKARTITWAGKDPKLEALSTSAAAAKVARSYVGSFWGVSGRRQFKTAKRYLGLEPSDTVLEVGCGALNAGQFFIAYLDAGAYTCVEPNTLLHNVSISESPTLQRNVSLKSPVFVSRDDFDPRPVTGDSKFDRVWSHSVLSHAADWQLMQYFEVVAAVMAADGVAMASMRFSDGRGAAMEASHDTSWIYPSVSYFDFAEARCMARRAGLSLELVPEARLFMTEVVPAEMHDWVRMRHAGGGFEA